MVERFQQLQALRQFLDLGFRVGLRNLFTQRVDLFFQIDVFEQLLNGFGTHTGVEIIAELFQRFEILLVVEQLTTLQRGHAGIDDHEAFEVQHALDITQRHIEEHADTRRQGFQKPNVSHRRCQLDVTHAFTAHGRLGHFDTTLLTDNAAVLHALIFAAQALVVFNRAENLGTEQTIPFRFKGTVVDGLRLLHLAEGPGANHVRRRQGNLDRVKLFGLRLRFEYFHQIFHGTAPSSLTRYRCPASGFPSRVR